MCHMALCTLFVLFQFQMIKQELSRKSPLLSITLSLQHSPVSSCMLCRGYFCEFALELFCHICLAFYMQGICQFPSSQHNMMQSHSTAHHDLHHIKNSHPDIVLLAHCVPKVFVAEYPPSCSMDGCIAKMNLMT